MAICLRCFYKICFETKQSYLILSAIHQLIQIGKLNHEERSIIARKSLDIYTFSQAYGTKMTKNSRHIDCYLKINKNDKNAILSKI